MSPLLQTKIKERLFYGWVVVIALFILVGVIYGVRYSFGVFFKPLESEFALNRTTVSAIYSAYSILCSVSSVTFGWALDRHGPRKVVFPMGVLLGAGMILTGMATSAWQLFITYSFLLAMGSGAGYPLMMATVSRWFNKKRGIAIGVASSGSGLGTIITPIFATYLIINFNWQTSFIVLGIIGGVLIMAFSLLLKKEPQEIGLLADGIKPDSYKTTRKEETTQVPGLPFSRAWKTIDFRLYGIIWLLWGMGLHTLQTHIVPHAIDLNISPIKAAVILSLIGGVSIPGRLVMGWVSDRIGGKAVGVICALIFAVAMLGMTWTSELWMFYLFASIIGFSHGGLSPPLFMMLGDTFGMKNIGIIMGVLDIGWAVGSAIGPTLSGFIFDVTQSYVFAFLSVVASMLLIAVSIPFLNKQKYSVETN